MRQAAGRAGVAALERGIAGLRIAVAGGYFARGASPEALEAVERIAKALGATRVVEFPEAARARAAAYVITATEGAALHLDRLRTRANDFDPAVRDRLIAGAMMPASLVVKAHKFRRWYRDEVTKLFDSVDAILAPATPCTAPQLGQQTLVLDGVEVPLRPNVGIYTQPISFIGLPVVAVPVPLTPLPIGVQIIAAPWREDVALRIAHALEADRGGAWRRVRSSGATTDMEIDLPEVVAEVREAFERYEQALVTNDVAALDGFFRDDPRTLRYGVGENLYGYEEIKAFRAARSPIGLARTRSKTVITTYGRDFAVASTLFHRTRRQGRPADADLGALSGRLARGRRARERDRCPRTIVTTWV